MCGISGIFEFTNKPVSLNILRRMNDSLVHRGPDAGAIWVGNDGRIGFAHRRLSIIDLSSDANQPMHLPGGCYSIVYNGEIYNHAEIKRELDALESITWMTHNSDTEVLLRAFARWGIDCLHKLRGDFAFAIWDENKKALWLARDRIGVKPLYFCKIGARFVFASEIKALLHAPGVERDINPEAISDYLSFLVPPAPKTMFKGISKLPAGCFMRIEQNGTTTLERYWDAFDGVENDPKMTEADHSSLILETLKQAVELRQVGDVSLGVFLSGGVDSSANAILFNAERSTLNTFTIGANQGNCEFIDESENAFNLAKKIGANHHQRRLSHSDALNVIPNVVHHQDEPLGDVVCIPLYHIAEVARENGVKVCQVGEGADELFCGYPFWLRHLKLARLAALPVPRPFIAITLPILAATGRSKSYLYELFRRVSQSEPTFRGGAEGLTEVAKEFILGDAIKKELNDYKAIAAIEPIRQRFLERANEPTALNWMTYLDLNFRLPELLLARVDKMTMAHGVEGRVPFLDHHLVRVALSVPSETRINGNRPKQILKQALAGTVPNEILYRRKQGFGLPMDSWINSEMGSTIRQSVLDFADRTGLLNRKNTDNFLIKANWANTWQLYNLAAWYEHNFEK